MGHSPRAKSIDTADSIRLLVEHHVVAVRKQRRTGEIVAIKHIEFGWISPKDFYGLQKMHEVLPLLEHVVEGGYRAKEALWSVPAEFTLLGTSLSLPLGMVFPLIESIALEQAIAAGNVMNILYWGYALLGPFGDALVIKTIIDTFVGAIAGLDEKIVELGTSWIKLIQGPVETGTTLAETARQFTEPGPTGRGGTSRLP